MTATFLHRTPALRHLLQHRMSIAVMQGFSIPSYMPSRCSGMRFEPTVWLTFNHLQRASSRRYARFFLPPTVSHENPPFSKPTRISPASAKLFFPNSASLLLKHAELPHPWWTNRIDPKRWTPC